MALIIGVALFSSCNPKVLTEEEHIKRISEKLQKRYFNVDGTPTEQGCISRRDPEGNLINYEIEGFRFEILKAYDEVPEYFLITHEPAAFGVLAGRIIGNKYRTFGLNLMKSNPYDDNDIEKENRYYV